jgi:hypothetical protein
MATLAPYHGTSRTTKHYNAKGLRMVTATVNHEQALKLREIAKNRGLSVSKVVSLILVGALALQEL